jgi:5'-3' exonuclease
MLLRFLREYRPDYLAVIFDAGRETFRHRLYPGYKGNRPETPADLIAQFPYIRKAVEALRVPMLELEGFEADDLIATLSRRSSAQGIEVIVVTGDKDLMQLVGESVRILDTMKNKWIGVEQVKAKFGVDPEGVVEVMGLAGDSIDNIPGVRGIGEKTAALLIRKFHSLENLFTHLDELHELGIRGAGRIRQALIEGKEAAFLSRDLATTRTDVPIQVELRDLRYEGSDKGRLRQLFTELDLIKLYESAEDDPRSQRRDQIP